jgi:hypothetical protein
MTNVFPNIGYTTLGRDFNFFQKITVTATTFGGNSVSGQQPDMIVSFPTEGLLMLNEDGYGAVVQVSFDGLNVHDELNSNLPSKGIAYDDRVVSKIWFRITSGSSCVVSVRAWGTR